MATSSSRREGGAAAPPVDVVLARLRVLRGPSIWGRRPVVACDVRLDDDTGGDAGLAPGALRARLAEALPGLVARRSGTAAHGRMGAGGDHGGLVGEIAALIADGAAELQTLAGMPVANAVAEPSGDPRVWWAAAGWHEESVGRASMRAARELVAAALAGEPLLVAAAVADLRTLRLDAHPGPTTAVLIAAARRRGVPVRRVPDDPVIQLGLGRNLRRIDGAMTDGTSVIAADITADGTRTRRILARIGLAVPAGDAVATVEEALAVAADIGFPVLLEPLDAADGRGASGRLDDAEAVRAAWPIAAAEHPTVLVERWIAGRDHRVVVVDGRVVAAAERVPAHVVGDGARTIRELAEAANREPARDPEDPDATLAPLPLDERTIEILARAGRTLDAIPGPGEVVPLRATARIATGATAIDRTDEIHPDNAALCELAADAAGLDVAGIEIRTPDIAVPFGDNGAAIIGVRPSPGIRMHTHPDAGTPRDVPGAILDMLYPPGTSPSIPVIAVTGTNGKTTTTRLIAHLFRHTGMRVGFTTTDGVYHQNRRLLEGDMTGPFGANMVLANPRVDVAVLETARGGILRAGLGYDECDVAVVLNLTADHLGLHGIHTLEQLARVKRVVAEAARRTGHAVLNADDRLVHAMREHVEADVVLFSPGPSAGNPRIEPHVARGGLAVTVDEVRGRETFVIHRGPLAIPLVAVRDVPLAMGGAARFQLENLLAGIAAAYVQGISYDDIRDGLCSFTASPATTPGRLNVMRTRKGIVVVDYAHNPAAVRGLLDFVSRLPAARRIGVVTIPGDRRDEDLREMGRLAAALDVVILKEHERYRRGRPPGEVARLIAAGLAEAGHPPGRHEVVLDEAPAVARALELMRDGDLVVILADEAAAVLEQLGPELVEA